MKRLLAIWLVIIMCAAVFAGCVDKDKEAEATESLTASPTKKITATITPAKEAEETPIQEEETDRVKKVYLLQPIDKEDGYANYLTLVSDYQKYTTDSRRKFNIQQEISYGDLKIYIDNINTERRVVSDVYITIKVVNNNDSENVEFDPRKIRFSLNSGENGILIPEYLKELILKPNQEQELTIYFGLNSYNFAKFNMYEIIFPVQEGTKEASAGDRAIVQVYFDNIALDKSEVAEKPLPEADHIVAHIIPSESSSKTVINGDVNQQIKSGELTVLLNSIKLFEDEGLKFITYDVTFKNDRDRIIFLDLSLTSSTYNDMQEHVIYKEQGEDKDIIRLNYEGTHDAELTYNITDLDVSEIYFAGLSLPISYGEMKRPMSRPIMLECWIQNPFAASTPTPAPTATPAPQETPEPKPTPKPTQTPEPTPEPSPTPVPEIKPNSTSSSLNELFRNVDSYGLPKVDAPKLDIPDDYLGDGTPGDYSLHDYAVLDDDGNLYYTDFSNIYMIDRNTDKRTVIATNNSLNISYKFGIDIDFVEVVSLHYKNKKLYAYVDAYDFDYQGGYFMLDVLDEEIVYSSESNIRCSYDSRMINCGYNEELEKSQYTQHTLIGNVERSIFNLPTGYKYIELKYVGDKYLFFLAKKYTEREDGYGWHEHTKLIIVDKETMITIKVIDEDELDFSNKSIILCTNSWMMLFDDSEGEVQLYNTLKGTLTTYWRLGDTNKFLGYDAQEKCIYIRKSLNYTHNDYEYHVHNYFNECVSYSEIDDAKEVFIKCNLLTLELDVLNTVMTKTYMDEYTCLDSLNEYIVGDYLFVYPDLTESESSTSMFFELIFKLGSEIDYDTWRD